MLNSAKKLCLLVVVPTVAGCGGLLPLFKSDNAARVSIAAPTVVRSDESVALRLEPVTSAPDVADAVITEPAVPDESVAVYSRPLAVESPIGEPTPLP
jgi:hypothetical protein